MEYQFVYLAYSNMQLLGRQRSRDRSGYGETGEVQPVMEVAEWSEFLNKAAQEGYTVKESGVLQMSENVILWAMLEKS